MEENKVTELKLKINEFIWAHAPSEMTLKEAERAAFNLLIALMPEAEIKQ